MANKEILAGGERRRYARRVPPALESILSLFAGRGESERRELLLHYAAGVARHAARPGEVYAVSDLRHDAECSDAVGIHLRMENGCCHFRVTLGPEVQTLTQALASILCEGLDGAPPAAVLALTESVVDSIAGVTMVRLRSRTVYYILRRMQEAVRRAAPSPAVA